MSKIITNLHKALEKMNEQDYIENFLIYNLSLVIYGSKPSATLTLKKGKDGNFDKWQKYGAKFIKSIDLDFIILREQEEAVILLVYNKEKLSRCIMFGSNRKFLVKLGYSLERNLELYLNKLVERYDLYHCPHELGIFLGFPVSDVKEFMKCSNKKCLICGYWKVYNNLEEAIETFDKFDFIRSKAAEIIMEKKESIKTVYEIRKLSV